MLLLLKSQRFFGSNFAFVLFCYITNHLMTVPLGNSEFCFQLKSQCFPQLCIGNIEILGGTKFTVPQGTSHQVLLLFDLILANEPIKFS